MKKYNKMIAFELEIAPTTVNFHLRAIQNKLGKSFENLSIIEQLYPLELRELFYQAINETEIEKNNKD